jgi:hypothetical protein
MGLKADTWIREEAIKNGMISPFCEDQVGKGVVSYGLSSYGYDIRVSLLTLIQLLLTLSILMMQMLLILQVMSVSFPLIHLLWQEQLNILKSLGMY